MITVAKNAGFCFGVRRATSRVEELISQKSENDIICTLGKLIHNEQYNKFLEDNGVSVLSVDGIDELLEKTKSGKNVTVVIRTHGIEYDIQKKLESCAQASENFHLVDCTCPYVKKIHKIASEISQKGEMLVLIGQAEHPEVKSIMSYAGENGAVFGSADELEKYLKLLKNPEKPINMAAQTTQN